MSIKIFSFYIALATVICACGRVNRAESAPAVGKEFAVDGDYIIVSDNSPVLQSIEITEASVSGYRASLSASGVVRAIPARYAEVGSPFAGRVVQSFVRLGQHIVAGSPVFEIHSPSFYEACKSYRQAEQEMGLALKSLGRERDLHANGIGSARSLEESEAAYELRRQEYELAAATLDVYRVRPEEIRPGQPLVIRSPIAGEVVMDRIIAGQYMREDAESPVIVADLEKVWVAARVKEKDLHLLSRDAEITVSLIALPERAIKGRMYHIGDLLDEDTRSVEAIVECDNPDLEMKPSMYGTVTFTCLPVETVAVPRSAVLQGEDNLYVLVAEGGNRFRKAYVRIAGEGGGEMIPVLSGVRPGDRIVSKGAFYFINAR